MTITLVASKAPLPLLTYHQKKAALFMRSLLVLMIRPILSIISLFLEAE